MRKVASFFILTLVVGGFFAFAQNPDGKVVDIIADGGHSIPYRDTTAMVLVGNFAAHHNGAVITSDSAIRYDDRRFEFFGNVLINKGSTYIYGDRAEYNGERNEAKVFSPLVKTVDGDAVLYTYDFTFNTLRNVGSYTRTGTLTNRDSKLESQRGFYYADRHEMIAVGDVQMRNDTYEMLSDSVVYNTRTDKARFFLRTHIWNTDGDYLFANEGRYEKEGEMYALTKDGYILTAKQELWSDSLNYFKETEHIRMWNNIQLDDTEQKLLAFGDYGEYWDTPGNALLTRRPIVVSYDPEMGDDSLYMRADTMQLFTFYVDRPSAQVMPPEEASTPEEEEIEEIDSLTVEEEFVIEEAVDSVVIEEVEELAVLKTDSTHVETVEDRIAREAGERLDALEAKRTAKEAKREARRAKRLARLEARERKYALLMGETTDSLAVDSLQTDSLAADSLAVDSLIEATPEPDTIWRLVKGYRNVKMYRTEYQMVCDSLVSDSRDSMVRLYYEPVVWNEANQIASDSVHLYTAHQEPLRAEFMGHPIMISEVTDTVAYNQVSGQLITAHFRNSELYRTDVDGSVQTIYYMQEEQTDTLTGKRAYLPPTEMITITSGNASYYIEEKTVTDIVYRNQINSTVFPMDKIPEKQELRLENFHWEAERRPRLYDILDRWIRPSQRVHRLTLEHPTFPISERIDTYRKSLIASRRWADRRDVLTPEVVNWMNSLK